MKPKLTTSLFFLVKRHFRDEKVYCVYGPFKTWDEANDRMNELNLDDAPNLFEYIVTKTDFLMDPV